MVNAEQHEDGLFVITLFFQLSESSNKGLSPIIGMLPALTGPGVNVTIDVGRGPN